MTCDEHYTLKETLLNVQELLGLLRQFDMTNPRTTPGYCVGLRAETVGIQVREALALLRRRDILAALTAD